MPANRKNGLRTRSLTFEINILEHTLPAASERKPATTALEREAPSNRMVGAEAGRRKSATGKRVHEGLIPSSEMTADDARKRGEADTPDERRGRCRSATLASGSRCRGCYPAKLTQRAPERSVEHTSERLKAKAPQPTPTQGDGLEEDGAQVRQRATHRQRRLFVRANDGATRRWSAGRKPRCDRHGHEEPGSRADRTERRGTVAAGRIGQRSRCDAGRTEARATRKASRGHRRHRAAETTGTDAAMRTGRTPPRGNQPTTPARRSWTRTHGREAKGQGLARPLDRGAHGSLRSKGMTRHGRRGSMNGRGA